IVVFSVGGLITISSRIVISSHVTIAGQTAPGQGITVYGNGISYSSASNTITRYIRFRMGTIGDSGKDAITIANGENMIFDHVSVSWGRDETFSINGDVSNITISDSIIAQGLQTHSCGGLIQTNGGVSIIRSLYIDNNTRNPKVKGVNEFVNNVDGTLNGWILAETTDNYSDVDFQVTKYNYPTVGSLLSPLDALERVIASAGASKLRDHVDLYLINTELGSLGKSGATISDPAVSPINGPGPIYGGTVPLDSDQDGIPDDYERAHDTNPSVNDSANIASNGYASVYLYQALFDSS
ncbi:hypothetical protein C0992_011153, partial [Termitomyces sp. T32_za158]